MLLITAAATGLLAGALHVVTGPDHMAAVAPLAIDSRRRAWTSGLYWGLGHSGGTWCLAAIALLFREAIPVDDVSTWSERIVGVVLIAVGLWGLHRVLRRHVRAHTPADAHDHGAAHSHSHGHPHRHSHGTSALGIGTLHGLAGTSHLLGILPALALPSRTDALTYVVAFGLGSIIAMTVFAVAVGLLARRGQGSGLLSYRAFMSLASVAAVGIGVFWIVDSAQP